MKIVIKLLKESPIFFIISFIFFSFAYAADQKIDLVIGTKNVNFAGELTQALAVNNQIPAPTLHFKEGDHVTINVHNNLDKGTTLHWHGMLLPWNMDGVKGVSQEAIPPGCTFSYKFTLKQSGTYWYHAHAGLQEQEGLYGGFIIDPAEAPTYQYTKDYVIVLSDWSNTPADQIYENLKKDGDYYNPRFPLQASLLRFIQDYSKSTPKDGQDILNNYMKMQEMRMSLYDISDVAYDAFLLNGRTYSNPWSAPVQVGDTVRLRFIGAMGSTIYRVKIPNTHVKVVHIQGHDVVPYDVDDFTISQGETIDVLVKIQKETPYIIYAESADTLGAAYGALVTHPQQYVDYNSVPPFPEPRPQHMGGMMERGTMEHGSASKTMDLKSQNHQMKMGSSMKMGPKSHTEMGAKETEPKTKGTKYQNLKSPVKTNNPNKPVQVIKMVLSGYMNSYEWFINDLPESEVPPILIEPGKRYRIIFTNKSMMHHPMHLHGHFFILRNGNGAYDPFLHTIEVPPGATAVADFDADVSGQWFFHCHHLYHMPAGMARVFRYTTFCEDYKKLVSRTPGFDPEDATPIPEFVKNPRAHLPRSHYATFLDLGVDPFHNVQKGTLNFLAGSDDHKLQLFSEDAEIRKGKVETADLDIFYWHPISEFWAVKGGANYVYKPAHSPYWQPGVGIEGQMPFFIDTNFRTYLHKESMKFDLELSRETQLTNRFFVETAIRGIFATKTVRRDEIGKGLNDLEYTIKPFIVLRPGLALFTEFNYTKDYGPLKKILHNKREHASETLWLLGVSLVL